MSSEPQLFPPHVFGFGIWLGGSLDDPPYAARITTAGYQTPIPATS
jgi:hypothetical protein